jgi:hypothetical protein
MNETVESLELPRMDSFVLVVTTALQHHNTRTLALQTLPVWIGTCSQQQQQQQQQQVGGPTTTRKASKHENGRAPPEELRIGKTSWCQPGDSVENVGARHVAAIECSRTSVVVSGSQM